jgi:hypothetical protein
VKSGYTAAVMLREFWARIRGARKKWPETQATVRSIEHYEMPSGGRYQFPRKLADVTFAYTDREQQHQYGSITVNGSSELYDAKEDDFFLIRVDPDQGDKYFSSEAIGPL